jgi:hypothetical protein
MKIRVLLYCLLGGLPLTIAALGTGHFALWWLSGILFAGSFVRWRRIRASSQCPCLHPLLLDLRRDHLSVLHQGLFSGSRASGRTPRSVVLGHSDCSRPADDFGRASRHLHPAHEALARCYRRRSRHLDHRRRRPVNRPEPSHGCHAAIYPYRRDLHPKLFTWRHCGSAPSPAVGLRRHNSARSGSRTPVTSYGGRERFTCFQGRPAIFLSFIYNNIIYLIIWPRSSPTAV